MPIVMPPTVVHTAMDAFIAKFFTNQPQRDHAARYLTGLMICSNKMITGMTSEQPNVSDQSCLNRFMTEVDWDSQKLNEERITWLQNFNDMKFHENAASSRSTMCSLKNPASTSRTATRFEITRTNDTSMRRT